jgi:hypothetical protein
MIPREIQLCRLEPKSETIIAAWRLPIIQKQAAKAGVRVAAVLNGKFR